MRSIAVAAIIFACCFAGGLLGIRSRLALPAHHLSEESKQLVQVCMGLIATMTALILGLVTASAKTAFDAEDAAVHSAAGDVLLLDRALESFGASAQPLRAEIREALLTRMSATWSNDYAAEAAASGGRPAPASIILGGVFALSPQTDAQRWMQQQALSLATQILRTRMLSLTGNISPVPMPFLVVLGFWLSALFWSFGLFAPRNATVTAVLLLAALSVSACVLLMLELQTPLTGMLRISSEPLRFALEHMGK